ncbi:MAG: hypothetical protein ACI81R_002958 [Bradymonadia bacterium]|jgi:hypothetical protein
MTTPNLPVPVSGLDSRITKSLERLKELLIDRESIEVTCVQVKFMPYVRLQRRTIVCATTHRLVKLSRGLLGGYEMEDFQWQDLRDASVQESVIPKLFGTAFSCSVGGENVAGSAGGTATDRIAVKYLNPDSATVLYRFCQQQEQTWREKNRVRAMEEARAASGGITLGPNGSPVGGGGGGGGGGVDPLQRLALAKELLESGVLTEAEFEETKYKILASL